MDMDRLASLAFRQQIERDMLSNLRLIGEARRGAPIAHDTIIEAERRLADCTKILGYA